MLFHNRPVKAAMESVIAAVRNIWINLVESKLIVLANINWCQKNWNPPFLSCSDYSASCSLGWNFCLYARRFSFLYCQMISSKGEIANSSSMSTIAHFCRSGTEANIEAWRHCFLSESENEREMFTSHTKVHLVTNKQQMEILQGILLSIFNNSKIEITVCSWLSVNKLSFNTNHPTVVDYN